MRHFYNYLGVVSIENGFHHMTSPSESISRSMLVLQREAVLYQALYRKDRNTIHDHATSMILWALAQCDYLTLSCIWNISLDMVNR